MATDRNDPDLRAVARAYRNARMDGQMDQGAYVAAIMVYRERHPHMPSDELTAKVSKLIRRLRPVDTRR